MTNLKTIFPNPYSAFIEARRLRDCLDDKNLAPIFASTNIKILPYQIAAAGFALRSKYLKGCILCDEGSLGKTYEALLVVAQKWYEGVENILIVLPDNLINQWKNKLENEFNLPFHLWEDVKSGKYLQSLDAIIRKGGVSHSLLEEDNRKGKTVGICFISYKQAIQNAEQLKQFSWDLAVFDEADFLFKFENKSVISLKQSVGNAFKLLLTPTPITSSIMDIYGLIHFIDEDVLPNSDTFYKRYFRKPENYAELSEWVSGFAFRTLKRQASNYVNFTNRLPAVINYNLTKEEKELYILIDNYLKLPEKQAYPSMDIYQLTLMFYHTISSSPKAFANMLKSPIERANAEEKELLLSMQATAGNIAVSGKMQDLSQALKQVFKHLQENKEPQKAIIFTENNITREVLYDLLSNYNITSNVDDFRNDKSIQILLASDELAKGLDIEFCPVVVNYDLLYNAVEMEQRICRCHRQGQVSDVLVINMLSPDNFSDVRILELINKRTLQFQGIFGMSDDIVGNFDESLNDVLAKRRENKAIQEDFRKNLKEHRQDNEDVVLEAENELFTSFTKNISDKMTVSPKYIEEQAENINQNLWELVKFYFTHYEPYYIIDDENKTLTLKENEERPLLFYYNNGTQNVRYFGKNAYGMAKDFKPATGRISILSILGENILYNIKVATAGTIKANNLEACEIAFYNISLYSGRKYIKEFDVLIGKTNNGGIIPRSKCLEILNNPDIKIIEDENASSYIATQKIPQISYLENNQEMNWLIDEIKKNYHKEELSRDDLDLIKLTANRKKDLLNESVEQVKNKIKKLKDNAVDDRLEALKLQKQMSVLEKELKQKEQSLLFDQVKIDVEMENKINSFIGLDNLEIRVEVLFKLSSL